MVKNKQCLADWVDPHIGGIGHLLTATRPVVMLPHSMAMAMGVTDPRITDVYLAEHILGFSMNHALVMPDVTPDSGFKSRYDHDMQVLKCYYGWILLEDSEIEASYTASHQSIRYKFVYPDKNKPAYLKFSSHNGEVAYADGVVTGYEEMRGARGYFNAALPVQPDNVAKIDGGLILTFNNIGTIELDVGVSYIDSEQAGKNRKREIAGKSFDEIMQAAKSEWNKALGRIEVEGGTDAQKRAFYTAMYRMHGRMTNITEDGRYYSGFDGKVHEGDERDFYVNDGIWDTYRCAHPMQMLLEPERKADMINSYLRQYQQCGWLPSFPHVNGSRPIMLGKHATAMIVDAWVKGYRDFDAELAYKAMKKNADEATKLPWADGGINEYDECYFEKGFFPALPEGQEEWIEQAHNFERRQSVAVTLETSYDDWCLSVIAKDLGKTEDAQRFARRGDNYKTLFNPEINMMHPRTADGEFVPEYDPKLSGGQGGRAYFAECNGWTYSLHVQHDIEGLAEMMGGPEAFGKHLDRLFVEQYGTAKYFFLGQFPDSTGLIGQFCMGNEPSFHIPYMYNYVKQPWKTQRRLREIMRLWFPDSPFGICGDEDGGAMSAWFVCSAMGFYPVCPGKPEYEIGSPIFDRVTINLPDGKKFVINAENQTEKTKYIQSATLNGQNFNTTTLKHEDIVSGGELNFKMSERPNKNWGIE